jgi:hypothetical protein
MTTQARRLRAAEAETGDKGVVDEGAERYIWVFTEGNQLVLVIPGLRGLKFSVEEARAIGEMLIQAADEITARHSKPEEGGDRDGSSQEPPLDS